MTESPAVLDERTGIYIVPSRDETLTDFARASLKGFYMGQGETVQQRYARAAKCWSSNPEHAQRLYDAVSQGHFMFASPVLSNAWLPPEKPTGLPISCFLNEPGDTIRGIIDHEMETRWLTVMGGGVGGFWNTRAESTKSPGLIPHQHTMDAAMSSYAQGKTRRGSYAAYVHVRHPNFREFLSIRVPTGDEGRKCLGEGYHHGAVIPDVFMEAVEAGESWDFIDPHDGTVRETIDARELWNQMLDVRYRTGEPYMFFEEAAQAGLPETMKAKGLRVKASNLCSEIFLPTAPDRTAVCCLSSLNCEKRDEWADTLVADLIEMLDNVLQAFIDQAPKDLWRAVKSAKAERSLGLGLMGFHYYLQSKGVAFESDEARELNEEIFAEVKALAVAHSYVLGAQRGVPEDMEGTGLRNAHLMAVAPNANSAVLLDTSPSIEPAAANAYTHRTRAGSFPVKNRHLEALLEKKGFNTPAVWQDIITSKGSVQHLSFLTPEEKRVFKTAIEIDQRWVVRHAADRQPFICQGQSVNVFFEPACDRQYFHEVHWLAWKLGLKSLYYVRTSTRHRPDAVSSKAERFDLSAGAGTPTKRKRWHHRIISRFKRKPARHVAIGTSNLLTCGTITASQIVAGSILAEQIQANGITSTTVAATKVNPEMSFSDDGGCLACEG